MSARDVISRVLRDLDVPEARVKTSTILFALEDAGYRILAPGELDSETLDAALVVVNEIAVRGFSASYRGGASDCDAAIRNLRSAG